jgi:hypothetical protein
LLLLNQSHINNKTMTTTPKPMTKVLIFGGKTGWIGGMMHDMCKEKGNVSFSGLEVDACCNGTL